MNSFLTAGRNSGPITLAMKPYGTLNGEKSNAILLLHALSGDAHAAGFHKGDARPGWWDETVGPGKAFDTDMYFSCLLNVLGGCRGSTGPGFMKSETRISPTASISP